MRCVCSVKRRNNPQLVLLLASLQEAILSAEIALSCSIDQSVLEEATELLVAQAIERSNRVRVCAFHECTPTLKTNTEHVPTLTNTKIRAGLFSVALVFISFTQVKLTWQYGGMSTSLAGDVVGGWDKEVPLERECFTLVLLARNLFVQSVNGQAFEWCSPACTCTIDTDLCVSTCAGNSIAVLSGLQPGVYYYKYIVDGTWAIDPLAPKVRQ